MPSRNVATISGAVNTPRGTKAYKGKVQTGVTPGKTAAARLRGVSELARDNHKTGVQGQKSALVKGDSSQESTGKGLDKKQRKALASSESGPMMVYAMWGHPGYVQPPASLSTSALQSGINFLEDYRGSQGRFLEEKADYPIASIQVLSRNGGGRLAGQSAIRTVLPSYTRFMLQRADMPTSEKYQLARTFKSFRLFMFGSNPQVWQFSGTLFNAENQNWSSEWRSIYNAYLRGTRCARIGAEVYLTFGDIAISGIMVMTNSTIVAENPLGVPFTFTIIVTNDAFISGTQIINVTQRITHPLGLKKNPPLVFELVRNIYARKYGQKEKRSDITIMSGSKADKAGRSKDVINNSRATTPRRSNPTAVA